MANRGVPFTDLSGAVGGGSTLVASANTARRYFRLTNPSSATESLWVNDKGGDAVVNGGSSWELGAGKAWEPNPPPTTAVAVAATTSGHAFEAAEG